MNKKLGKVAAIALSAAMITSAFAMSTSASFAATATVAPKAPVAATAKLTDATKTLYMDNTTSTKVMVTGQNGETGASTNAPTSFGIASLTKKSDSTDVTSGATYDFDNASIAKASGDSVDLTKDAATGNFKYGFEANGKTGATVFTVSGVTASDAATGDNYTVDPFSFTVDSENKTTFSKGVLLSNANAEISDATVGNTLHVAEVYMTASQTSGTFAAIPLTDAKTLAPLGADTLSATPVTGSATIASGSPSTVTPTAAGSLAVAYKETPNGTYKSTNTITVKQNMTLTAVTAVTKAANGGYDVTDSKGAEHYDDLTGYTLQLAAAGATIGTDVVADTIDASQMTASTLKIDGASVKTITGVPAAVTLDVQATNLGKATSVGAVTTAGAVTIGSTSDKSTVAVDSVTESTTGTAVAVTSNDANDLASTTAKSIKADNVTVNSKKAKIGAIAANGTAGTVTVSADADGVSLPALTGYELDANGDTTVASIDAATKDVKIADGKTLTVTGTAKVQHIYANTTATNTTATSALSATTGTVKIGAGKLTLTPAATEGTTAANVFKLVLSNAQPYGAAFTLSSAAATGNDAYYTAVPVTPATYTAGTGCLANICIAGTQGFVNPGDTAVTLGTSITETGLNNACPTATKFTAGTNPNTGSVDVENGSAVLAVEPTPLKTLPAGYSVKWEAANGYVNLSSTTGLSTTVSGTYDSFNTYKNTDTVTATMKNSAGEVGRFTYTVNLKPASVATTTDFSVTAPATAIATDANGVFEIVANGATPINKANVTVSSDNQAVINDKNTTIDKDGTSNNVKVTVLGSKAGTANLTFKWVDPSTGKTLTHTAVANVADEPVYAYVDGRVVNPTDTISIAQSTTKAITFITATGKKIDTFNYNAGNGKIMSTRAPASTVWNGVSGDYGMYMNGPVGSVTGVYVNNQKICNVKVADRPFTCDTTYNFNLKAGKTYEFKLTPAAGTTFDNFTFNTAKDAALSTNGYKKNADGTINAFVKAVQKGTYGVYVTINGVQYKVFAVTVD